MPCQFPEDGFERAESTLYIKYVRLYICTV